MYNIEGGTPSMTEEKIARINEFARRVKAGETLSPEELEERAALRKEYIDSVKASLVGNLENTYLVDEKGNKVKLPKKKQ